MLRAAKIAAFVSVILLVNAVTTLLFVQARVPAIAQVPAPCVDGDVNGDSGLDIGDPVYLLQYLFDGGPAPVACAQTPTPAELADAVDTALARFLPRAGDRVLETYATTSTTAVPALTVPADRVLRVEEINTGGCTVVSLNGVVIDPIVEYLAPRDLLPGDVLELRFDPTFLCGVGGSEARMWLQAHWLDAGP